MWLFSSQSRSFSLHSKEDKPPQPQLHLQQSLLLSPCTSPSPMQNILSRAKAMWLLLLLRERVPPNYSGLKVLGLPAWSKVSQIQCRLPQEDVKRVRTVLKGLKVDLTGLEHRWLAQTKKRGTVKGQIQASTWVQNQWGLGAALLSVLDRYVCARNHQLFRLFGWLAQRKVSHHMFVFTYSEGKSHSEVCEECPVGVWRGCTRLCPGPDNLCSLPQVGFCASRTVCMYVCEIKKRQAMCTLFHAFFFLLSYTRHSLWWALM